LEKSERHPGNSGRIRHCRIRSDCPAGSPLLWVYDIDRVEILAFTGDSVEILREIIKDQIDQTK